MIDIGRFTCLALVFACGTLCRADALSVGFAERAVVDVPQGVSNQADVVRVAHRGVLDKTGSGDWTLPLAFFQSLGETEIDVRSGSLTLAALDAAPPMAEPTGVMGNAALWMDATRNVVVSNGADGVAYATTWKDVRETKDAVPYDFVRAVWRWSNSDAEWTVTNAPPQLRVEADGTASGVFFGRYRSGRWMQFQGAATDDGGDAETIDGVLHAFVVYRAVDSYWYVAGTTSEGVQPLHPGYSSAGIGGPYTSSAVNRSPVAYTARMFLDGVHADPTVTPVVEGRRLLEWDWRGAPAWFNAFANGGSKYCRPNSESRQGGDDLCEVLLFTNRLTEAERMEVSDWLVRKWRTPRPNGGLSLAVADGAAVNVDAPVASLDVVGEGLVVKRGAGETTMTAGAAFTGAVSVEGGSLAVSECASYLPTPGETATADVNPLGVALSSSRADGTGAFVKRGSATLHLSAIPEGVERVDVAEGELAFRPRTARSTVAPGDRTAAEIANGSFELDSPSTFYTAKDSTMTWSGWTYGRADDGGSADYYAAIQDWSKYNLWSMPNLAPDGTCAMAFRGLSFARTDVAVPVEGVYEISFASWSRNLNPAYLEVWFGPADGTMARLRRTAPMESAVVRYQTLETPRLAPGAYRLEFRSRAPSTGSSPLVDDVKMALKARTSAPTPLPVPNGGFEDVAAIVGSAVKSGEPLAGNVADGWSFAPEGTPFVGLALCGVTNSSGVAYQRTASLRNGVVQLILAQTNTSATATFRPPRRGRFRLSCEIGKWAMDSKWHGHYFNGAMPQIHASIQVGAEAPLPLGAVSNEGWDLVARTLTPAFEFVDTNAVVTLVLSNAVADTAAVIDNLAFEPADLPEGNVLADGGFETDDVWTLENAGEAATKLLNWTSDPRFWGYATCEGKRRLRIVDRGSASQPVSFPSVGAYCLNFYTSQRYDSRPNYGINDKGLCPFRAWIARDGVTNVIGQGIASTTNYMLRAWTFDVPSAGVWTFGFEAMNVNPTNEFRDRAVYFDDALIVPCERPLALPAELEMSVSADARLRLDFTGTNEIRSLRLNGRSAVGIVNAATHPAQVFGAGSLFIRPRGTVLLLR